MRSVQNAVTASSRKRLLFMEFEKILEPGGGKGLGFGTRQCTPSLGDDVEDFKGPTDRT